MINNPQPNLPLNPNPPFYWNQLSTEQQNQLAFLLARLLMPHLKAGPQQKKELSNEQPS